MPTQPGSERQSLSHEITQSTELACDRATLWGAISRMDQINFELAPYLQMTVPCDARDKSIEDAPLNQPVFTSVILLFGVVPIDLHFIRLSELVRGHKFVETSFTLVNATWRHERTISALADHRGCQITDRVGFRMRLPMAGPMLAPLVRALFAHRHRRLLAKFGAPRTRAASDPSTAR